jgi:hypothetical protein
MANGSLDPVTFAHGGDTSYYLGNLFGTNVGHIVDETQYGNSPGIEAHYDRFGPWNPLHWIFEWLPSTFINPYNPNDPGQSYTCTTSGCLPNGQP